MQAQDPLGKVTTADVSLFLKHNDPERKETQTSQAKQSRSGPSSGLDAVLQAGPPPWAPRGRTLSRCTRAVGGWGVGAACWTPARATHHPRGFQSLQGAGDAVFGWMFCRAHSIFFFAF